MKRLWTAALFAVIITAVCLMGMAPVNVRSKNIREVLLKAEVAAAEERFLEAASLAKKAEEIWVETEKSLHYFVNHADLAEIGVSISRLESLARNGDKGTFLSECRAAAVLIIHLTNEEMKPFERVL